jgi:hypothetical protein
LVENRIAVGSTRHPEAFWAIATASPIVPRLIRRTGYLGDREADQSPSARHATPAKYGYPQPIANTAPPRPSSLSVTWMLTSPFAGPLRCCKPRRPLYQLRRLPDRMPHPNTKTKEGAEQRCALQRFRQVLQPLPHLVSFRPNMRTAQRPTRGARRLWAMDRRTVILVLRNVMLT